MCKLKSIGIRLILCVLIVSILGCGHIKESEPKPIIDFKYSSMFSPYPQKSGNLLVAQLSERKYVFAYQKGNYNQVAVLGQNDDYGPSAGSTLLIKKGNKYGLIDSKGKLVVDTIYDSLRLTSNQSSVYIGRSDNESAVFNGDGQIIIKTQSNIKVAQKVSDGRLRFIVEQHNLLGVLDDKGNMLVPQKYKTLSFSGDYLIAQDTNGNYGVLNGSGDILIPFEFKQITTQYAKSSDSESGALGVYFSVKNESTTALMDIHANRVLKDANYDVINPIYDFFQVQKNNKMGIVGQNNNIRLPLIYDSGLGFKESNGQIYGKVYKDGKPGIFDQDFNFVVPCGQYDEVFLPGPSKLLEIIKNGKYGFLDLTGREVIPAKYDDVSDTGEGGLIAVKKDGKYGFVDYRDQVKLPIEYDYVQTFSNGVALVSKNGKCGYINNAGKLVVPMIYDYKIEDAKFGKTSVYTYEDTAGKGLILAVNKNDKWGAIEIPDPCENG